MPRVNGGEPGSPSRVVVPAALSARSRGARRLACRPRGWVARWRFSAWFSGPVTGVVTASLGRRPSRVDVTASPTLPSPGFSGLGPGFVRVRESMPLCDSTKPVGRRATLGARSATKGFPMNRDELQDVTLEVDRGLAWITMNRPDRYNALRGRSWDELIWCFKTAWADPDVGVIALTGAGDRAFCAGGDLKQLQETGDYGPSESRLPRGGVPVPGDPPDPQAGDRRGQRLRDRLRQRAAARVRPHDRGRHRASSARPGPRVGSWDAGWGTAYLARVLGEKRAREFWYLCRQYDAATMERWGLVNEVVPLAGPPRRGPGVGRRDAGDEPHGAASSSSTRSTPRPTTSPASPRCRSTGSICSPAHPRRGEGGAAFQEKRPRPSVSSPFRRCDRQNRDGVFDEIPTNLTDEQPTMRDVARKVGRDVLAADGRRDRPHRRVPCRRRRRAGPSSVCSRCPCPPSSAASAPTSSPSASSVEELACGVPGGRPVRSARASCSPTSSSAAGPGSNQERWLHRMTEPRTLVGICLTEPGAGSDSASLTRRRDAGRRRLAAQRHQAVRHQRQRRGPLLRVRPHRHGRGARQGHHRLHGRGRARPGSPSPGSRTRWASAGARPPSSSSRTCSSPTTNLVGEVGDGFRYVMHSFDASRPVIGVLALGDRPNRARRRGAVCRGPQAVRQASRRVPGHAVHARRHGDRHRVGACARLRGGPPRQLGQPGNLNALAAMAKCYATDVAMKVTTDAVQVLGGAGYMRDFPVERMMRDAKIFQIFEGTNQIQRMIIGRHINAVAARRGAGLRTSAIDMSRGRCSRSTVRSRASR